MNKTTVVVAGGGFAGYTLIRYLAARAPGLEVILVDPREEAVFLPLLPDAVAGKVRLSRLLFPFPAFCRRHRSVFIRSRAARLPGNRTLVLEDGCEIPFDYLVVSAGQEPNFYGNDRARAIAFTLAGPDDARRLRARLEEVCRRGRGHTFLVVGGGYTGVETASALVSAGRRMAGGEAPFRVRIAELAPRILGNLPEIIAGPARREVARLGIEVSCSAGLEVSEGGGVTLDGETIPDLTLVWSAGMRPVDFVRKLDFPKDKQGRLRVGPDLSLPAAPHIFALGDCASVAAGGVPLRMAVQFSWAEGTAAARNIRRRIAGKPALPYRPRDYGYLIPVASGKAWGEVLGARVGGSLGSVLHYFMCVYRTLSWENKIGIIRDLILKGSDGVME
ncbi:MAG: FAD-dependent oxidoreductase [PVC group bacterium]